MVLATDEAGKPVVVMAPGSWPILRPARLASTRRPEDREAGEQESYVLRELVQWLVE